MPLLLPRSRFLFVRRGLAVGLLLLPLLLLALAWQPQPALPPPASGANAQLATQARLMWAQLRPSAAPPGALRQTLLEQSALNALLEQATQGRPWRAQLAIAPGSLALQAARPLGAAWPGWWNWQLRWDLRASRTGALPPLAQARLGRLPLPAAFVEWAAWRALPAEQAASLRALLPMLQGVQARPQQLQLQWRWQPAQAGQALAALWPPAEREALRLQQQALHQRLRALPPGMPVPLHELLSEHARLAQARVDRGASAATELRALLAVLTLQALGRDLSPWLPEAADPAGVPPSPLLLRGRDDMAQHFLIASLLSWQGGERVSAALGLAKELADARVGSGFSFTDLAADEVGQRFGRLCAADPAGLLRRLAAGLPEAEFFPEVADLPEFLAEPVFRARYQRVGSPAYEAEMQRLRARVAALPLFQMTNAAVAAPR